jgi:hypothetical protein
MNRLPSVYLKPTLRASGKKVPPNLRRIIARALASPTRALVPQVPVPGDAFLPLLQGGQAEPPANNWSGPPGGGKACPRFARSGWRAVSFWLEAILSIAMIRGRFHFLLAVCYR